MVGCLLTLVPLLEFVEVDRLRVLSRPVRLVVPDQEISLTRRGNSLLGHQRSLQEAFHRIRCPPIPRRELSRRCQWPPSPACPRKPLLVVTDGSMLRIPGRSILLLLGAPIPTSTTPATLLLRFARAQELDETCGMSYLVLEPLKVLPLSLFVDGIPTPSTRYPHSPFTLSTLVVIIFIAMDFLYSDT